MDNQTYDTNPQSQALEQLVKELGIDTLPEDKQNELLIKMTEVLLKRIFLETMEKLGEKGREEYMEMTAEGKQISPEQIDAFLKDKIKNYDEVVKNVIGEFKEEMMTASDEKQQPASIDQQPTNDDNVQKATDDGGRSEVEKK